MACAPMTATGRVHQRLGQHPHEDSRKPSAQRSLTCSQRVLLTAQAKVRAGVTSTYCTVADAPQAVGTYLRSEHCMLCADCLQQLGEVSNARIEGARLVIAAVATCPGNAVLHLL